MEEPHGRVCGVVFAFAAVVVEAVGNEAVLSCAGECSEYFECFCVPAAGEQEAWQRDHRIAAPIAEPRVSGDDGGAAGPDPRLGAGGFAHNKRIGGDHQPGDRLDVDRQQTRRRGRRDVAYGCAEAFSAGPGGTGDVLRRILRDAGRIVDAVIVGAQQAGRELQHGAVAGDNIERELAG